MSERGMLEKMLILAYESPDYGGEPVARFEALVNPGELVLSYEMEYDSAQGAGTNNSRMQFKKQKPGDLNVSLFIDGTGASGRLVDVQEEVERFQSVTGYNGNIHRPNYLKVVWGTLQVRRCILKSVSVVYKLFKPDGAPLRAVINAVFTDNADDRTRVALAQDQSPDLTHVRLVKAGDTLPGLCAAIYNDPLYYLEVARFNRLDDFRNLQPGARLIFPPLE